MENNEKEIIEEQKSGNRGRIIYLVILVVVFAVCSIVGYNFGSKLGDDKNKEEDKVEEKVDDKTDNNEGNNDANGEQNPSNNENVNDNQNDEVVSFEDFNYEEVTSIILEIPCADCGDPVTDELVLTDKEEIKYILSNIDKAEFVSEFPAESGFASAGAMTIEVVYSDGQDPSTKVVFLANDGEVAINYSVGVAENNFAKYKISNPNFEDELLAKYQK